MLIIEFLPAHHGDCILVRWGTPERVMVVDGGPDGVYEETLRPRLTALPSRHGPAPTIDVLCLTHIDDDHVVGVIRLLTELVRARRDQRPSLIDLQRVWFNGVDDLIDAAQPGLAASVGAVLNAAPAAAVAAGYSQGRDVRTNVAALALGGNNPFGGLLTVGKEARLHELKTTVIGPTDQALETLRERWRASVRTRDPAPVASAFIDRSVPNMSSIALHLEYGGRTVLLTGDARGDHILSGLRAVGLLTVTGTVHVHVFKLPHHGSENNAAPSLFEHIRADHYVVSADGIRHPHPNKATLEWLVASRARSDAYTIHLTHSIPAAEATLARLSEGHSFTVKVGIPCVKIDLMELPSAQG